jgi:outer membrane protein TolC
MPSKITGGWWQAGLLALLTGAFTAGAVPLTFEEAVQRVETHHEALRAAESTLDQRDAERAAAKGLRYPEVDLELRRYVLDSPVAVGIDGVPISLEVQSDSFWSGQITMKWPLYTGGRINAANDAAVARQDEAHATLRTTEHTLLTELAERYFGVKLARRNRDIMALKLEAMQAHEARAHRLLQEGIIARIEFLNVQVAVSNAARELEDAQRAITIVEEALANTIVGEAPIDPTTPLFLIRDIEGREAFVGAVAREHPVMAMFTAKEDLATQGVRAKQGENLPTVYAFGSRELAPDDLTMLDPEWAVGLGAQYTLFDGGQGKHEVRAAKAQLEQVEHLRRKYQRDLETLTVKRHEEMLRALDQYDALEKTLELTAENLRVRTRAFEEGVATSVEIIDATLNHALASLGRYKAAYDFDLAFFQLLEASGRSAHWGEYMPRAVPIVEQATVLQPSDPEIAEAAQPSEHATE